MRGVFFPQARIAEEEEGKRLLQELEGMGPKNEEFESRFARVRELVLTHAENEELEEFPGVREHYSAEDRQTLGSAFKAAVLVSPTHPHPRDPNRPPANVMAGTMLAVADHMRDASRSALDGLKRAG